MRATTHDEGCFPLNDRCGYRPGANGAAGSAASQAGSAGSQRQRTADGTEAEDAASSDSSPLWPSSRATSPSAADANEVTLGNCCLDEAPSNTADDHD